MALKFTYDSEDDFAVLSEEIQGLYTQKGDTWVFSGVEGVAGPDQVKKLKQEAGKYRIDKKKQSDELQPFIDFIGDRSLEEVQADFDMIDELKLKAEGANDPKKLESLVEARLNATKAPLERQIANLQKKNEELSGQVSQYQVEKDQGIISQAMRLAASESKAIENTYNKATGVFQLIAANAFEVVDGQAVVKDGNPYDLTPGNSAEAAITELRAMHPECWPASKGGGASGSGGGRGTNNPWSKDSFNLTEQSKILYSNPKLAEQLKNSAK